ncbi:MEDS domain-containing protein [Micromonospora sp. NPDC023644]|uniref:MEDS domain-containing protein n=1 Tax=Micromonospora sp. NPDC023644 TaxID=3154321 RepID=UPI0033E1502F
MTGGAVVEQVTLGDHVCWTYDDDADALDAVARFVVTGLRLGQKVLCLLDALEPAAVVAAVRSAGGSPDAARADGRLRILPAVEIHRDGGRSASDATVATLAVEIARAHREGHSGLRLVNDMAWAARDGAPLAELRRHEAAMNALFPAGGAAALCLYDRRLFPADRWRAVASVHPATAGPGADRAWVPLLRAYRTADPPGLRLVGQLDWSNRGALGAMLTGLAGPTPSGRPAVLDVSDVSFADVAAASALLDAERTSAPDGFRLVGCRPVVRRLLDLVRATGFAHAVGRPA